jgi:signal transduction histidine kinase
VGVEVRAEEGSVIFRVWDTGIGIAAEDQAAAFEPFRQLEQSSTREVGGTGLGLSVVQRLVQLLGGTLRMQSEPGRGTSVEVALPLGE